MKNIQNLILLNTIEEFGFKKLEALLNVFQSTSGILKAKKSELLATGGVNENLAEKIVNLDKEKLSKELRLMEEAGISAISIFDDEYPNNLKNIYSPPIILYVKGEIKPEDADAVAIVGTRRPSYYGMSTCEKLASQLASKGITVISGLARGIDTMAHKGAIREGRTIAVLGSGLNYMYPPENKKLAGEICQRGAVISEFPMNMFPNKLNFPRRNRVISGLSLGVVVVEAAGKSGSLITANFALEQNRDIFAVPGQAASRTSAGSNSLIKQGAKLVENADDIISEIENNLRYANVTVQKERANSVKQKNDKPKIADDAMILNEDEKKIKKFLSYEPTYIDELAKKSDMDVTKTGSLLLSLELKKFIKELPGKNFVLA